MDHKESNPKQIKNNKLGNVDSDLVAKCGAVNNNTDFKKQLEQELKLRFKSNNFNGGQKHIAPPEINRGKDKKTLSTILELSLSLKHIVLMDSGYMLFVSFKQH